MQVNYKESGRLNLGKGQAVKVEETHEASGELEAHTSLAGEGPASRTHRFCCSAVCAAVSYSAWGRCEMQEQALACL